MQIREPAKITCVITSFNQSRLLEGAVYSVLRQSLPVEEILICDDGSQDESRALIAALEDEFPNVKGICREHNIGPALNRHFAILKASNPFVTQLDGDDRFHPKKLEKEWNVLEGSCEAVAFSDIAVIGPDGNSVAQDTSFFGQDVAKTQKLRSMLQRKHPVPRDMLLSKDLYVRTGGYEAGVPMYEDWSLKLRLMNLTSRWTHSGSIGTYYDRTGEGLSKRSEATRIYWQLYCIARNFDWLWNEVEPLEIAKGVQRVLCWTTKFNPRTEAALAALSEPEMNERLQRLMSTVMTAHDREPASSNAIEEAVERFSALSSELLSIGMQNEE